MGSYSSIISRTVVDTFSLELSFQMSSGFSCVPSNMCTAASALSRMASMKTPGRKRISVRRTWKTANNWENDLGGVDIWRWIKELFSICMRPDWPLARPACLRSSWRRALQSVCELEDVCSYRRGPASKWEHLWGEKQLTWVFMWGIWSHLEKTKHKITLAFGHSLFN